VKRGTFRLLANTLCTKLVANTSGDQVTITQAEVRDLLSASYLGEGAHFKIAAKSFVVAGGAIGTLQLLAASEFGARRGQDPAQSLMPSLGKYLSEQSMCMAQVVMDRHLVDAAADTTGKPEWWVQAVNNHRAAYPNDPMPIPCQDADTAITLPVSVERPWHVQIRRDGLTFGEPRVEPRTIIELVYFGMQEGVESNHIVFENDVVDQYGMPQPTINYLPTRKYADQGSAMIAESVLHEYG
jgi:pyranose oxidase